ncbi:MAG: hypothetical protein AABZ30_05935, partial [Myxococcota bacterium]
MAHETGRPEPPVDVTALAPREKASLLREAQVGVRRLREIEQDVARGFLEYGSVLNDFHDQPQRYALLGSPSFPEFVESRCRVGLAQAYKLMQLARVFPPRFARYG